MFMWIFKIIVYVAAADFEIMHYLGREMGSI